MESSNPVFKRREVALRGGVATAPSSQELEKLYNSPSASSMRTGRMTIDDVVTRTGLLFGILVVTGAFAWTANLGMGIAMVSMIAAMILGFVLTMKARVVPGLAIAYAALEGLTIGTISHYYESAYPGIVSQAIIGTLGAFAGVLFAYKNKKIRVTEKFNRMMGIAMIGYMVIGLASFVAALFGVGRGYGFYGVGGIGLLLCVAGVGLATFFLVMDFDQVEKMIAAGAPHDEAWRAGFGLMVTVVWLYLEILRLLSILRER